MKLLSLLFLLATLVACATDSPPKAKTDEELSKIVKKTLSEGDKAAQSAGPKAEVKPEAPKPIELMEVPSPDILATLDPVTLKVTYKKGVDPKKVIDSIIRQWVVGTQELQGRLQACQQQLQIKK